jgi:signal peptide peptidase SppA
MNLLPIIAEERWAIRKQNLLAFAMLSQSICEKASENEEYTTADFYNLRPQSMKDGDTGHVWIQGVLVRELPPIYEKLGYVTRYQTAKDEIKSLIDSGVTGLILHINSPGGTVSGCIELAKYVSEINLPVLAYCEGLACSAAYKIASSANRIVATPSAEIGNIGAILSWADVTEFWKNMGVEFKALTSEGATLKSTFHLDPNEEQLAFLQESINESGRIFREHVAMNRAWNGVELDEEVYRAGWYSGERALSLGLIDAIGDIETAKQILDAFSNIN